MKEQRKQEKKRKRYVNLSFFLAMFYLLRGKGRKKQLGKG